MSDQGAPGLGPSGAAPPPVLTGYSIRRQIFRLGAAFIVVSGLIAAIALAYLRGQALESGERLTGSFAHIIEEQTERTLEAVDQRLQLAEVGLAQLAAAGRLDVASARDMLGEQVEASPSVRAMLVLDTEGRAILGTDPASIGNDYSDRDYFRVFRTQPLTTLYVGPPVRGRTTGTWGLGISRPRRTSDGSFAGVLAATVEPLYLNEVWSSVRLGNGGVVALLRRDGTLMMRTPFDETAMGGALPNLPVIHALEASPAGTVHATSPIDAIRRVVSYRSLSAYPDLLVLVGQTYDVVLAPWRQLASAALGAWALSSLAILALLWFLNQAWQEGLRTEEEVQKVGERLSLATGAASIGVGDWRRHGPSYASPAYHTMLGYPAEPGFGNPDEWLDRVHPEDRDQVKAAGGSFVAGGNDRYQYEARMRHADGSYRWVSTIGSVVSRDQSGQATRLVGVRFDVTKLKQAEEAVRESETRFRTLIEWLPEAVIVHRGGRLLYVNQATVKLLGARSAQDLLGKSTLDFVHPDFHPAVLARAKAIAWTTGVVSPEAEEKHVKVDGTPFDASVQGVSIVYEGKPATILSIRDTTERKRTTEALATLVREKDALLREVHHRVKNNLALITSLMRLEAGQSQEPETKAVLKAMQTRIHSVLLLNETLYKTQHYSKIELSNYLGGMATHLFHAQNPDPEAVRLVLDLDPVEVDSDQAIPCGLIANELMTNSLKHAFPFGKSGEVRVSLKAEPGGMVRLTLSDTGVGLPADFDARRAKSLGLQLVADLARQLQGTLKVGPGPTFTIAFAPRPIGTR